MSLNGRRRQLRSTKELKHCQNAFQASCKVERVDEATVLLKSSQNVDNVKMTLRKRKYAFGLNNASMLNLNAQKMSMK